MPKREEWRWIPGLAGKYLVSNFGRVRSFCRPKYPSGYTLKQSRAPNGYLYVNVGRRVQVHVLVCQTFNGKKPTPKHEVAHHDGMRANNAAANLSWKTRSQNNRDQDIHGTRFLPRGENNGHAKLSAQQVVRILRRLEKGQSSTELAEFYSVAPTTIRAIRNGYTWNHVTGKKSNRG